MRRRRGLRFRLLSTAVSLALVAIVVVNVVAVLALRDSLLGNVDAQLEAIPDAPALAGGDQPVRPPQQEQDQFLGDIVITTLDQRTGAIVAQVAGPALDSAPMPDLSTISSALAAGQDLPTTLLTVPAIDDPRYDYRVRAVRATTPDGVKVLVLARSLAPVADTVRRVATILLLVSLLAVVLIIAIGAAVVRLGLRPLDDVEGAARRIADGDFSARAPHEDEGGEVGSLARTFNSMAAQVGEAFVARQRSEDQLRVFLADASHELRTPLTTIRAYSELIRTGTLPADPSTREAIGRIESEATRMGVLVEDLLLLARLDQHPALRREDVDIAELARETVDGLVATAPDHALTVRADAHDVNVVGDAEALRQVVSNLVRNAVLHTPPGTHVDVTVSAADDDVALVVVDDGPGMVDEVAAHAFDRFYRPEPGRMRNSSGTGLGLAIVRSVAEAHGGDVSLVTSPGHGARFEVRLPRRRQT